MFPKSSNQFSMATKDAKGDDVEHVGPVLGGRVKSFSQKSGWGFIQLFEDGEEDPENSKDVFFHRADVTRAGTIELKAGILVHCRVVTTGKGEKASEITILEEHDENAMGMPTPGVFHLPGVTIVPDYPMHHRYRDHDAMMGFARATPDHSLSHGFAHADSMNGFPKSFSNLSLSSNNTHCPYPNEAARGWPYSGSQDFHASGSMNGLNYAHTGHFQHSPSMGSMAGAGFTQSVSMSSITSVYSNSSFQPDNAPHWGCLNCYSKNMIPAVMRVMVVCEDCGHAHGVRSWQCTCGNTNGRHSRFCNGCEMPYRKGCREVHVQPATGEEHEEGDLNAQEQEKKNSSKTLKDRSRWQQTSSGWDHSSAGAAEDSTWCQENNTSTGDEASCSKSDLGRQTPMLQNCKSTLFAARDWLLKGAPCSTQDEVLDNTWLYRFSEEICNPVHGLVCPTRGHISFSPNPCLDLSDHSVLHMYEAIGTVMAIALANGIPLHPSLPVWMARSLLGCPPSNLDLQEFDPKLHQRVEMVATHADVESLQLPFTQEIERFGVAKTFEHSTEKGIVTEANKQLYGPWLNHVYLSASVETQLKQIKVGFFGTLMGDALLQGLTPVDLSVRLEGKRVTEMADMQKSLRTSMSQPHLEKWLMEAAVNLSARQWQLLLRYVTGYSKAPCSGPEHLITAKFDPSLPVNSMPLALKASGELVLPQYSNAGVLNQMLMMALGAQINGFTGY